MATSKNKTYSFSTGWFGRASEKGHTAKSTKVHTLRDGKPLCGYKPHKTMQYQMCAQNLVYSYIECSECKKKAQDYEYKDRMWAKKQKQQKPITLIQRKNKGEKLTRDEDWAIHTWLYDNDKKYRKAFEECANRHLK